MSEPLPVDYKIIDVLVDILTFHMDLREDQIWIYNQKRKIPETSGLFIEVAFVGTRPFGSNSYQDEDEVGNFCEFQAVNVQEAYKIVLYSRDESAFTRAHEVLFAINSNAMQQACEKYSFHVGRIPHSFIDTSAVEASARLFRQDLDILTLRHYTKKRVIDYFDKFNIPPNIHVNP
jgi:hypothetical protein